MLYRWMMCVLAFTLLGSESPASELKEFGVVPQKYLDMTTYPEDTSAAAVRLFDVGEMVLQLRTDIERSTLHHYQIKILKESGKSFADVMSATSSTMKTTGGTTRSKNRKRLSKKRRGRQPNGICC